MKIHLPLALRGLLLSLLIPGTHLTADITDVPGIGYTNPSFDGPVTQNLHFTQYAWKGNYNDPDNESNGDRGTGWIRIELSKCDLSLSGSPESADKYDVTFSSPGEGSTIYTGRALHIADGSTFEASYLGVVSLTGHVVRNAYSNGGAVVVKGGGTLHFHHNDTVLFEENVVYGSGGAISLHNGSLLMEENAQAIFRNNGASGKESLAGSAQGGAISMAKSTLTIQNNGSVLFEGNANRPSGGAISTSTMNGGTCVLTFTGNDSVSFIKNTSESDGGAIHSEGSLTLNDNQAISFSQNSGGDGGAINGACNISGNGNVLFDKNTGRGDGGAIRARGDTQLNGNQSLTFSGNSISRRGGAVYISEYNLSITDNESVTFQDNTAGGSGGSLFVHTKNNDTGSFDFRNNGTSSFIGNTTKVTGGAILIENTNAGNFVGNKSIQFSGNRAGTKGGALCITRSDTISFTDNVSLQFSDNKAGNDGGSIYSEADTLSFSGSENIDFHANQADGNGGAISQKYNNPNCSVTFSSNDNVNFSGNSANGLGGAIYTTDTVSLINNGAVTFRFNHQILSNAEGAVTGVVLNGIYATRNVALSTRADVATFSEIVFYDPLVLESTNGTTTLNSFTKEDGTTATGTGRIVFSGEHAADDVTALFTTNGLETSGENFDTCLAESKLSRFGNKVVLAGGTLEAWDGATVMMQSYTARSGSGTFMAGGGALTVTNAAAFEAGSTLGAYDGGGTLTAASVSLAQATLDCDTGDAPTLTLNADVSLADSTAIFRAVGPVGTYIYGSQAVAINGNLTVSGTTRIVFAQSDEQEYQSPTGTVTLLAVDGTFSGTPEDWTLVTSKIDPDTQETLYQAIDNGYVFKETQSNGTTHIQFASNDTPPPPPPVEDTIVVSTGESKSIDDLSKQVRLEGGTLDATGVDISTPLTNNVITGNDGLLEMKADQTLVLKGKDEIGYDLAGQGGEAAGNLTVGIAGGVLAQTDIQLQGEHYDVAELDMQSGRLTVGENAVLGRDTTALTLGSSAQGDVTTASLINKGSILAQTLDITANAALTNNESLQAGQIDIRGKSALDNGGTLQSKIIRVASNGTLKNSGTMSSDVTLEGSMVNNGESQGRISVEKDGRLSGSGTFAAVDVASGGYLMAGNSPGAPVYENLTLAEGATMAFAVDGPKPATASGSGTHSFATVSDTLTIDGTPNVEVSVGSGIVAAGSDTFTLTLLQAASVAGDGSFDPLAMTLTGETGLLEEGASIAWDAETGTLTFTGKVNQSAAGALSGGDAARLADTLWSSTMAVASFGRRAMDQGRTMEAGKGRFWASGFGNFTSMSQAGSLSGFNYNGGGYAVGGDVAVSDKLVLGASLGQEFGTHKTDDALLSDKQRSLMFALYGNYREQLAKSDSLDLSGYFAYGSIDHTAHTHVGGSQATPGRATWDDDAYAFGMLAHWNIQTSKTVTVSPFTGLTYMRGSQGGITETFDGGSRRFEDGSMQVWSIPAGLTVKTACAAGNGQVVTPELTVAYVGDIARQNPRVRTQSAGNAVSGRGHAPGRSAVMARAGLGWKISDALSTGAWYTIEARSGQTNQSVNLNVTYTF